MRRKPPAITVLPLLLTQFSFRRYAAIRATSLQTIRALSRVTELGGSVIHPGERWAICRDSEGSPFALAAED